VQVVREEDIGSFAGQAILSIDISKSQPSVVKGHLDQMGNDYYTTTGVTYVQELMAKYNDMSPE
jgi:hypothetical protein